MANTTNYNWETPDDTDLVKDGAAAIRTLGSSVDTTTKALNPSTTLGDIEYRSATANTNTRLAIGTTGQVLTVAGGVPTWATSDDANAIQNALLTTTGDTIYASGASTPARLGIGSTGQVLTVAGGVPSWATPAAGGSTFVGCSLSKTGNQSINNLSITAITWDTELKDTNAFHDNSTNNSRITIPAGKGGLYLITGQVSYAANSTGYRVGTIKKNGSDYFVFWNARATDGEWSVGSVSNIIELAATDYLEMFTYHNAGTAVNINGGNTYGANFGVQYLGA